VTKCGYVDKFFVDRRWKLGDNPAKMSVAQISDMLAAAGQLCRAVDGLRAAGLLIFAEEIDSLLKILDAEICVIETPAAQPPIE